MPLSRAASALVYLPGAGGRGSLRRGPDEPVPDDAAGLRAANARLLAVVEAKDGQIAMLTAALEAGTAAGAAAGAGGAPARDGQHGLRDAFIKRSGPGAREARRARQQSEGMRLPHLASARGHGGVLRALCCWLPRSAVCGKRFDGFAEF